jgi:hypothetical protein
MAPAVVRMTKLEQESVQADDSQAGASRIPLELQRRKRPRRVAITIGRARNKVAKSFSIADQTLVAG